MTSQTPEPILIAALYKFCPLPDYQELREPLLAFARANGVKGSLLLADEGVNGTISGDDEGIMAVLDWLRKDERLADLVYKTSRAQRQPFYRMKVRLKTEIVRLGVPGIDPLKTVGTYVPPEEWNDLISDPDVVVVDTRNDYEFAFGTFEGAIQPETRTFRQFPKWVNESTALANKPKVAMFCTGGIRCEKATSLLLEQGFSEVYHLEGGILNYLEKVPVEESKWRGECFVFDDRVAVDHALAPTWGKDAPEAAREVLDQKSMISPYHEDLRQKKDAEPGA